MELHFKDLREGHNTILFEETQGSLDLAPSELFLMRPVEVELSIFKARDRFTCYGKIKAQVEPECARCLKLFTYPLSAEINFILDQSEGGSPDDFKDDDYEFVSKAALTYDVRPRVREALLVSLPLRFICSPECRGLCPQCGTNLNLNKCNCESTSADPRWEKLQNLYI